tara:strand:- start:643 stop:1089 length:447 start_codon:yes stop_codon:yes gene_type:complete
MALTSKKYTRIYSSEGNDSDKIDSDKIAKLESDFNSNSYLKAYGQFDMLAPVLHILQKLTEEIDYLRTEIELNKNKTGITTKQATAITNNSNNIDAKMTVIPNQDYSGVQNLRAGVVLNKDKSYSLVFSYAEVTPKGTTTRTGSIQLK